MLLVDAGAQPSPRLARLPAVSPGSPVRGVCVHRVEVEQFSLHDMERLAAKLQQITGLPVCCRFTGPAREPANTLARQCQPALVLVEADAGRLDFWAEQARLLRLGVKDPAGLLVAGESMRSLTG
jgi:hypothetical protein